MHGAFLVDFYGDKVISYVLASGSAAGFGATKDLKALADATNVDDLDDYFDKAYASASCFSLHLYVLPFYLFSHLICAPQNG
ncbi:CASP-like protein 4D1 [Gossypium australe]|uniref:CASP-like protein 4D1 n=1 Tax=Gossypium australe TaxID=47621 RepID=A0A5B6WKD7_9ROSI|nr:CASP-like protein 4D1 [Gossypium australe]